MRYKDLLLPKIVFEVKYKQGYRYLDRCGETMIEIEDKLKGWVAKEAIPSIGQMSNTSENIAMNFSSLKLDLARYEVSDLNHDNFIDYSRKISDIVAKNLGIKEYLRFGLRYWFLYPLKSAEEGRKILSNSKIFTVNKDIENLFGRKIKDTSSTIVLEEEQIGHRIALSMVYREGVNIEKGEKNKFLTTPPHKLPRGQKEALNVQLERRRRPSVAILIDIDNYAINPQGEYLDNFIDEAIKSSAENAIKLIGG